MTADRYEMVVGLEVHVQLKTRTKAFCGCSADFGAAPNVNTCPVCLALPGALPVLNEHAVNLATRAALGLGCAVNPISVFARKNYFYPDLPKGYQISQFDQPLATGGSIAIGETAKGADIRVGITRVHMEEDAGKSIHDRYPGVTAIDLNRSGVPLIEIVSEPDIRSSAVERALESEFARQCALIDSGGRVEQQTLLWDGAREEVRPSRSKEGSHDYRYFPEPDLRPLLLDAHWIERVRHELPELPDARRKRLGADFELATTEVDQLTASPAIAEYFEAVARASGDGKSAYNWVMGEVSAALKASGGDVDAFRVRPADLAQLLNLVRDGTISHTAGKRVFARMVETGKPAAQVAADEGLLQVGDDAVIAGWVDQVLVEHPDEAARYLAGEKKLQGVLVGLVMRKSGGRADPKRVNQLLASRAG